MLPTPRNGMSILTTKTIRLTWFLLGLGGRPNKLWRIFTLWRVSWRFRITFWCIFLRYSFLLWFSLRRLSNQFLGGRAKDIHLLDIFLFSCQPITKCLKRGHLMFFSQGIHSGVESGREDLILSTQLWEYQKDTLIICLDFPTSLQNFMLRFELIKRSSMVGKLAGIKEVNSASSCSA